MTPGLYRVTPDKMCDGPNRGLLAPFFKRAPDEGASWAANGMAGRLGLGLVLKSGWSIVLPIRAQAQSEKIF